MDSPTKGTILVGDTRVSGMTEKELTAYRRHRIGFVFQFYNLVPNLTALENIQLAREICKDPLDAREILNRVGLSDRKDNFPSQMSGGEQQRVSIARALAGDPSLILADEPTGALDSKTSREVLNFLKKLNDEGNTIVMITHDSAIAKEARRVIRVHDGKINFDGDVNEYSAIL